MTHAELCDIAVKWLKRSNGKKGHGCNFAVSELRTGWDGEVPDAIGFRAMNSKSDGSVLVEAKTSRSDFLADKTKPHRITGGVGNWRYFIAPTGLIKTEELPEKWGLIEVNGRGHIKVLAGAALHAPHYGKYQEELATFKHVSNTQREMFLLVRLLARIGDVEETSKKMKALYSQNNKLADRVNQLQIQANARHAGRSIEPSKQKLPKEAQ